MSTEAVLQSISRQERRLYLSSLTKAPVWRIEARHRYLMMKELPYRDHEGKTSSLFRLRSHKRLQLRVLHSRRPTHHENSRSTSLLSKHLQPYSPQRSERRISPARKLRESRCDVVVRYCEEMKPLSSGRSMSPSRQKKSRGSSLSMLI